MFSCDSYEYLFTNNSSPGTNIKSVHEKTFPCESIGYLFTNNSTLSTHIKYVQEENCFVVRHVIKEKSENKYI